MQTWTEVEQSDAAAAKGITSLSTDNDADLVPRWGVIHVHTDHSDGNRSVPQVVEAAAQAGLDFVIVTDHNTQAARCDEGYHGRVLLGVEVEVTPSRFGRHLLALGLERLPNDLHRRSTPAILAEIHAQNAFAWVPHPAGFLNPWLATYNAPWRRWDQPIDGIELSTFLVDWAVSVRPWNLRSRLVRGHLPDSMPSRELLARWDRLNQERSVVGFVGLDAHYRQALGGRVRTPAYEQLFRTHQLVAWTPPPTGDAGLDLEALRTTLREGRFANVLGAGLGRADVRWERAGDGLRIAVATDDPIEVCLIRDGHRSVVSPDADGLVAIAGPGLYRAEIYCQERLWVLTNPIRVGATAGEVGPGRAARSRVGATAKA
ncbi:MAG: PHP domain-containing protein [Planctomycetota bacterium]